jgi:hypothetical protein
VKRADGAHPAELRAGSHSIPLTSICAALRRRLRRRDAAEGHRVVNRYRMEDRLGQIRCPTLVIA